MQNKLNHLSIGKILLLVSVLIITVSLLVSNLITFWRFSDTSNEMVEETSSEITSQILLNYNNYTDNVIDIAHFLELEILLNTEQNQMDTLEAIFQNAETVDSNVLSISLFSKEGDAVVSTIDPLYLNDSIAGDAWFNRTFEEANMFHFTSPSSDVLNTNSSKRVIHMTKTVNYYHNDALKTGALTMALSMDNFESMAQGANLGEHGHIVFIDEHGEVVYTTNDCDDDACESAAYANAMNETSGRTTIEDVDMFVSNTTLNHTRWQMVTFFDESPTRAIQQTVLITVMVVLSLSILFAALLSWAASRRITKPLNKLKEHMLTFEENTFLEPLTIEGQQEVVVLSETFNKMSEEIKRLVKRVYREQSAKRKNQFIALQNQINPHFLYNTLDSILYLSEQQKNDDVKQMVASLSKFFRLSISTESGVVALSEELKHVESYLAIQRIRYQNTFEYTIDCDASLKTFKVLKLSLQPLVENAINHGIDPETSNNQIDIHVHKDNIFLYASVTNSGYGLSPAQIEDIKTMIAEDIETLGKIGLANVYQRLKLHFGVSSDIIIESEMDQSTTITLKMPLKGND